MIKHKDKLDFNLLLLKALVATSRGLRRACVAGFWLVIEVVLVIFLNPISAIAWFFFFDNNSEETTSRVSHETNHNIIWYNTWVSLPIIISIAFLALLKQFLLFLIVSPQKDLILNNINADLPEFSGFPNPDKERSICAAEDALIAEPKNYDLNLYATAYNHIQISNRLFGGPKLYSHQLLSSKIFNLYYLKRFYGRFDSALFRVVGHLLYTLNGNRDLVFLVLQSLKVKDLLHLMQTPRYYSQSIVYLKNHCKRFIIDPTLYATITTDEDVMSGLTRRELNASITRDTSILIIKAYLAHRGTRVILDLKDYPADQKSDIENQSVNMTHIIPELQQSNLCQPFLGDQDNFVDFYKQSPARYMLK